MKVTDAITEACRDSWPHLAVTIQRGTIANDFIDKIVLNRPFPAQNAKIWIGDIVIHDDEISLQLVKISNDGPIYKNVLSDPASLDEIFTILTTHVQDVEGIIPVSSQWGVAGELLAKKARMVASLSTRLQIKKS